MDPDTGQPPLRADADRQICCTATSVLLRVMRRENGEAGVARLLEHAGASHGATYLEDVDNWISLDEASALFEQGVIETGDVSFARRVGEETLQQHAGTQVATLLRSLGSPEAILTAVAQTAAKFSTVTDLMAVDVGPGHAEIKASARAGFTRRAVLCDWTTGMLSAAPLLFGLPPARVSESECQARGGAQCRYTVTWDAELAAAAADPQQRVTALESQLSSVSERLRNAYATASDLVSTEDLDTVLHRIVERAANAVRAPTHVLAIRTEPGEGPQVYMQGIDRRGALALARATLDGGAPAGNSTLVVEVTSSRRHYGQLIAHYPSGVEFFPQDREMLGMYAKHAAAVLDTAMALRESAQRHSQVNLLLSLSEALAQTGTSDEVAKRLAEAIPEVIDCDRMGVWLWDDGEQQLTSASVWGRQPEHAAYLLGLKVSPKDTPSVARMAADPQPVFHDDATEDPFLRQLMATLDAVVLAVVPIVARGTFLGALSVSVTDHPERLRPDGELIERLTGVAALAAPAIQNARLVDELHHNASHDGLTGLLNLVGFRQHIDRVLTGLSEPDSHVGLLFIDLNEFKLVNDTFGHEGGDELLRQAAARLRAIGRDDDRIARLGGDEFAVILADVDRDDQVRAAEERVRVAFAEPFTLGDLSASIGASVGGVVWPEDGRTVGELVRRADAAMYEDKAEHRRTTHERHQPLAHQHV